MCSDDTAEETQDLQQPEDLDKFAETMENLTLAADALSALKSPRSKGKGKARVASSSATTSTRSRGRGKGASTSQASSRKDIQSKKAQSTCRACGDRGFWAGDPECVMSSGHDTLVAHDVDAEDPAEALAIDAQTLEQHVFVDVEEAQPKVTLDSGCNHNVIGEQTLQQISQAKPHLVIRYTKSPVQLAYRFGGGEVEKTAVRVTLELTFLPEGHRAVTFSVVGAAGARLPPLLGREYLDDAGATVDFKNAILKVHDNHGNEYAITLPDNPQRMSQRSNIAVSITIHIHMLLDSDLWCHLIQLKGSVRGN